MCEIRGYIFEGYFISRAIHFSQFLLKQNYNLFSTLLLNIWSLYLLPKLIEIVTLNRWRQIKIIVYVHKARKLQRNWILVNQSYLKTLMVFAPRESLSFLENALRIIDYYWTKSSSESSLATIIIIQGTTVLSFQ